jgi:hypothetical protein
MVERPLPVIERPPAGRDLLAPSKAPRDPSRQPAFGERRSTARSIILHRFQRAIGRPSGTLNLLAV